MMMKFVCLVFLFLACTMNAGRDAEADKEYRRKPALVEWSDQEIECGGIGPHEIVFHVYSVDKKEMLWYVKPRHGKYYTKESRTDSIVFSYGEVLPEWRQKYPYKGKDPRAIHVGETIYVYFNYTFSAFLRMQTNSHDYFFRKEEDGYREVFLSSDGDGMIGDQTNDEFYSRMSTAEVFIKFDQRGREEAPPGIELPVDAASNEAD